MLDKHGIKFSKSKGQNFLIDANIPEKIVRLSGIDSSCDVLEVGPGLGALTAALSKVAGRVTAVELDGRFIHVLNDMFASHTNVRIVQGDILKTDIAQLVSGVTPGQTAGEIAGQTTGQTAGQTPLQRLLLCANLPYNITTPAITAVINAGLFESMTVMVQREVARRICAKPASPDYGAFTVFVNFHASPATLFDVPPECFYPRPGVWSSVVMLKTVQGRGLDPVEKAMLFRVVRAAFGQRRKTLVNALHSTFGDVLDKSDIEKAVTGCGFAPRVRGERLSLEEFTELSKKITHILP